jgi:dimethylamine monooxygenase subunit A
VNATRPSPSTPAAAAPPGLGFDFDAAVLAPFRMQPGLRRLAPGATQLTPLAPGSRHQREKLAVLSAFPTLALQAVEGFDARPALHALATQAAAEHPAAWAWDGRCADAIRLGTAVAVTADGDGTVQQREPGRFGLGDEVARCLQGLPPRWRLAGLLALAFAEDLAVVDARDGRIPWLAVALPSHWAPADKLGLPFAAVHAPVADGALVRRAADALVRLAAGPERWERFVWNVTGHPRLHAHPRHVDPQRWPDDIAATLPAGAWWRSERQTFVPLPDLRQAVFTIAVDVQPLTQAIDSPDRARRLHDALASMSLAVLEYRALAGVREPLLAWLRRRQDPA